MKQKKWVKPQLVILLRGSPENAVLSYCKGNVGNIGNPDVDWTGTSNSGAHAGCRSEPMTMLENICSDYSCKMKTEGFSGPGGENACPGTASGDYIIEAPSPCEIINGKCYNRVTHVLGDSCHDDPLPLQCRCGCCLTILES